MPGGPVAPLRADSRLLSRNAFSSVQWNETTGSPVEGACPSTAGVNMKLIRMLLASICVAVVVLAFKLFM